MPIDPEVKQWLQELKESACAADQIAQAYPDGIGLKSVTPIVQLSLVVAETKADTLLDSGKTPSFDPDDAGSNYTPITIPPNSKLNFFAATLKQEACDALDKYCNNDTDGAAEHVRRLVEIVPAYEDAVGAT